MKGDENSSLPSVQETKMTLYISVSPTAFFSSPGHQRIVFHTHYLHQHFHSFSSSVHNIQTHQARLFTFLTTCIYHFSTLRSSHYQSITMHLADIALLLLAGTAAATPREHWRGKWGHFHHHSSFPSLGPVSSGFAMPSGTGTAPFIPQGTVQVLDKAALPKALVSSYPSSTESDGDDTGKETAKPDENPG